jgi:hypothetical protein
LRYEDEFAEFGPWQAEGDYLFSPVFENGCAKGGLVLIHPDVFAPSRRKPIELRISFGSIPVHISLQIAQTYVNNDVDLF